MPTPKSDVSTLELVEQRIIAAAAARARGEHAIDPDSSASGVGAPAES
jgi:hypothetical protein